MTVQTDNAAVPVLELRSLCKSFGGLQATRQVSLRIMPGDRQAIIGPNGAGKTTLFNLITGIHPVTSGEIFLFGSDVTKWPSHRRTAMGIAHFPGDSSVSEADGARQRAARHQRLAVVKIRDVAFPVVLQGCLRESRAAARWRRLSRPQEHRSA